MVNEFKSWQEENHVYELVDVRKYQCHSYETGRWVLTIKRDKDGNFEKCKARWVLRGFLDTQGKMIQTDSHTATRPEFRLTCQAAANKYWDQGHIDLKTAFLQGDKFDANRDVVCEMAPEAGYPPYIGVRLVRSAYGLKDAPRLWWNRLDKTFRTLGMIPTRADRCCYVEGISRTDPNADSSMCIMDNNPFKPEPWDIQRCRFDFDGSSIARDFANHHLVTFVVDDG